MNQLKIALMGYGHIGKVHHQAINQSNKLSLAAVIDKEKPEIEEACFADFDTFLCADIPVDLLIVATPNGLHFPHAAQALQHGFHVLVEKPITLNSQDFERLIHLSEQSQRRIFNMLQLRFSPVVQWLKSVLAEGKLGEIYMVNTQCYWNRNADYYQKRAWHGTKSMDGGVLFTQFSHFVDVLHYWYSELKPKDIRNFNFNHQDSTEFADSGIINFEIPSGGFGSFVYTISTYPKNFESTITVIAEKGTVQIGGQYMNQINYLNAENVENPFDKEIGKHFHQKALEDIAEAIHNNRKSILDAENARNVIKFLEVVS